MRRTSSISATYTTTGKPSFALMAGARDDPRASRNARPHRPEITMSHVATAPSVLIRTARGSDGPALARLAILDSSSVPSGDLLVAESDGELVAARSLANGDVIADPFRPSADVVALLAVRARALAGERPRRVRHVLRPARVASRTA